jgi:hypothetical protein
MQAGKFNLMTAAAFAATAMFSSANAYAGDQHTGKTAASQQQQEAAKKQVNAKGVKTANGNMVLVGELVDTRDVMLKGLKEEKHRLLKVKPGNDSQAVIVDIGVQDPAASFGLMKGDRVIAIGKSARINDRPVLFARSIGELYPIGAVGSVARAHEQMKQDKSARSATPGSDATKTRNANAAAGASTASIDPPNTSGVDEIVVWFDTDNLASDQYGYYDEDFVWITTDPAYSSWNSYNNATAWNDNWEKPHWDVWGYDDADEWGLFDW